MPPPLSPDEEAVVRALGRASVVVPRVLEADLVREQGLALTEYWTLMALSEAPERRLRMSQLAAERNLSVSGMTRVVTRLEAAGLVERVRCPGDARGSNAVLTDAGLARLEAAYPTHLASVRRHVIDYLGQADLPGLADTLARLAPEDGGGC